MRFKLLLPFLTALALPGAEPKALPIHGWITGEGSAPLPQASIQLSCDPGKGKLPTAASTETDGKGEFTLKHAMAGSCVLAVSSPGYHSKQVSLGGSIRKPVELGKIHLEAKDCQKPGVDCQGRVLPSFELTGKLQDKNEAQVANATIELICEHQNQKSSISTIGNPNGEFRMKYALEGICSLTISAPGFLPKIIPLAVPPQTSMGTIRLEVESSNVGAK